MKVYKVKDKFVVKIETKVVNDVKVIDQLVESYKQHTLGCRSVTCMTNCNGNPIIKEVDSGFLIYLPPANSEWTFATLDWVKKVCEEYNMYPSWYPYENGEYFLKLVVRLYL
jgi:hypothetical protein